MSETRPLKELRDRIATHLGLDRVEEELPQKPSLSGLTPSAQALVVASTADNVRGPILFLCPDPSHARTAVDDLVHWRGEGAVHYLPPQLEQDDDPSARTLLSERLRILEQAGVMPDGDVIVAPGSTLLETFQAPETDQEARLVLKEGHTLDRDRLVEELVEAGLRRETMVAAPGEFSVRGDVIDLYPLGTSSPVRIELFDDEIESIREFDVQSQRSRRKLEAFIVPRRFEEESEKARELTLFEALPSDTTIILGDPSAILDRLEEAAFERPDRQTRKQSIRRVMETLPSLRLLPIAETGSRSIPSLPPALPDSELPLRDRLARICGDLETVFVFCGASGEKKRLLQTIKDEAADFLPRLRLRLGSIEEGVIFSELRVGLINHHEIQGRRRFRRRRLKRDYPTRAIEHAFELSEGDYVVHAVHGVARYRGESQLEKEGRTESYLLLEYDGETLLYVPASKIDLVERYVGAGAAPRLDRMGGKSFAKKKAQVQKAAEDLAAELLKVQATRESREGDSYGDDPIEAELAESFPYPETPDQQTSIDEVRNDLASTLPMDRLLCGDVGFGKTEVAIRAAFKIVVHGRQVAILVPTTLLADQHLETFRERYANFPVRVESVSRFVKPAKQRKIVKETAEGKVDILIGTHRILSKDVSFRDLGLVIIDEEQRFGVRHKERLKQLRETVDVLTMTATPIPRTLHMALSGLRDISSLRTPPLGRLAPKSKVQYQDDDLIKKAIHREVGRGGQVFLIHNRVQGLPEYAAHIHSLVPTAKIDIAHGQMEGHEVESITDRFIRHEIDVLVCTTIVESGIDIPRVNTLIVDRADRFGLAELHQLRGRVGRSDVQAYAYFLIPRGPLATIAMKRLRAIESLSHLGSGFELSLRDLELRGAGNLLGGEQHGHINAVGYDLYCRLLKQCVDRQRGAISPIEVPDEIDIEVGISGSIPAAYIEDAQLRMEMLRRLAEARSEGELQKRREEMRDRFGRLPDEAEDLVSLFAVRDACRRLGVRRLFYEPHQNRVLLQIFNAERFEKKSPIRSAHLRPTAGDKVYWMLGSKSLAPRDALARIRSVLCGQNQRPKSSTKKTSARNRTKRPLSSRDR